MLQGDRWRQLWACGEDSSVPYTVAGLADGSLPKAKGLRRWQEEAEAGLLAGNPMLSLAASVLNTSQLFWPPSLQPDFFMTDLGSYIYHLLYTPISSNPPAVGRQESRLEGEGGVDLFRLLLPLVVSQDLKVRPYCCKRYTAHKTLRGIKLEMAWKIPR